MIDSRGLLLPKYGAQQWYVARGVLILLQGDNFVVLVSNGTSQGTANGTAKSCI
jgi:hypothetical protein